MTWLGSLIPAVWTTVSTTVNCPDDGNWHLSNPFYASRSGQWLVVYRAGDIGGGVTDQSLSMQSFVNGGLISDIACKPQTWGPGGTLGTTWQGFGAANSTYWQVQVSTLAGDGA